MNIMPSTQQLLFLLIFCCSSAIVGLEIHVNWEKLNFTPEIIENENGRFLVLFGRKEGDGWDDLILPANQYDLARISLPTEWVQEMIWEGTSAMNSKKFVRNNIFRVKVKMANDERMEYKQFKLFTESKPIYIVLKNAANGGQAEIEDVQQAPLGRNGQHLISLLIGGEIKQESAKRVLVVDGQQKGGGKKKKVGDGSSRRKKNQPHLNAPGIMPTELANENPHQLQHLPHQTTTHDYDHPNYPMLPNDHFLPHPHEHIAAVEQQQIVPSNHQQQQQQHSLWLPAEYLANISPDAGIPHPYPPPPPIQGPSGNPWEAEEEANALMMLENQPIGTAAPGHATGGHPSEKTQGKQPILQLQGEEEEDWMKYLADDYNPRTINDIFQSGKEKEQENDNLPNLHAKLGGNLPQNRGYFHSLLANDAQFLEEFNQGGNPTSP